MTDETRRGGGTGAGRPNRDMVQVTFSVGRAVRDRAEREAREQGVHMADVFRHWVGIGQEQDDARSATLPSTARERWSAGRFDPGDEIGPVETYQPGEVREASG